jgi:RNA polymerase sigma-70 factor (ECF subfamily)
VHICSLDPVLGRTMTGAPGGADREGLITMSWAGTDVARGLDALRTAVAQLILADRAALAGGPAVLFSEALATGGLDSPTGPPAGARDGGPDGFGDADRAVSSEESEADRTRLIALVELARTGDSEAFGLLYDHYQASVYRFLFYRTRSTTLAEDLTSETFFRALRSMTNFRWQGKDFGAWLMTIARNLATDHFKAGRTRLELATEDMGAHDDATEGPESTVLAGLTNELLLKALKGLPDEQRDCLIMRFLQGMSISETAAVLGRSDGAVKQLQLRGVRNLAKLMPEGIRDR